MSYEESLAVVDCIDDGIAFVTVAGAIDVATVHTLRTAIDAVLAREPQALVLDLSAVDFLASAGIQCLVETHKRLGPEFILVASTRVVVRPLMLTRLDAVLTIVPTPTLARAALRPALD